MTDLILIRGGWLATMDARTGDLREHDVLIRGNRIERIAPRIEEPADTIVDATDCLVLPGLIDTHRHTWETLLRGVGIDWLHAHYYAGVHNTAREHFTPDFVRLSNYLGALDAIEGGVTTLVDWSHIMETRDHAEAAIDALRASGLRAIFAFGGSSPEWQNFPNGIPHNVGEARRIRSEHFASDDGLLRMMLAARGPEFTTMEVVEHDWALARELDIPITVHIGAGIKALKYKPIAKLDAAGLLGPDTTFVHGYMLTREEFQRVADTGGSIAMAPEIATMLGVGKPPVHLMREAGILPSISTDEVVTGSGSMLMGMRAILLTERARFNNAELDAGRSPGYTTLTAREALEFATVGGAGAVGRPDELGTLAAGRLADVIVVRMTGAKYLPVNDAVNQFVSTGDARDIDTVIIDGIVRKRDGKLVGVDLPRLRDETAAARDLLFARVGRSVGTTWLDRAVPDSAWLN